MCVGVLGLRVTGVRAAGQAGRVSRAGESWTAVRSLHAWRAELSARRLRTLDPALARATRLRYAAHGVW